MLASSVRAKLPMLTRVTRFIPTICAVIVAVVLLRPAFAAHDLDLEYAEHQPLATESMFLDISRIGDTLVAVGERGHVVTSHDGVEWTQAEIVPTRSTLTTVYSCGPVVTTPSLSPPGTRARRGPGNFMTHTANRRSWISIFSMN